MITGAYDIIIVTMTEVYDQKIKISVYGAQHTDYQSSLETLEQAERLGKIIAEHHCILTIPATTGFPYWVAKGTTTAGGQVIGFSAAANEREHVETYRLPTKYMETIIYSGFGYAGADLLLSRTSDAIIFGYGGVETIHEFWVAFQEGKPMGVLRGIWSTDEVLHDLLKSNPEFDSSSIIFDEDPVRLVEQLVKKAKHNRVETYHV
jgi:predicted Rossmann-fold nucleotide-binding protein